MSEALPVKVKEHTGLQLRVLVSKVPDREVFPEKDISQFDFGTAIRGALVPSTEIKIENTKTGKLICLRYVPTYLSYFENR